MANNSTLRLVQSVATLRTVAASLNARNPDEIENLEDEMHGLAFILEGIAAGIEEATPTD
jgi:hypothetical protein